MISTTTSLTLLGLLLAFAATALSERPPPSAFALCQSIGRGSGCSGCNSPTVDCEWCTSATDDSFGKCAPEGYCSDSSDNNDRPLVPNPLICPANIRNERAYKGEDYVTREDRDLFSPHFEAHYCEFPVEPYPVDRTATPIGPGGVTFNCNRVNLQLNVGQRGALDSCMGAPLTPKNKECLRYYQSLLCTVNCPSYGQPIDYTKLCPDYCDRLFQHCDEQFFNCMTRTGIDLRDYVGCASPSEASERCFAPTLIPTSGKFEYDLCFYGDSSRCKTQDCVVELSNDPWPVVFEGSRDQDNYVSGQRGPICCEDGDSTWEILDNGGDVEVGVLFKVIQAPAGGISCSRATENLIVDEFGDDLDDIDGIACSGSLVNDYCTANVESEKPSIVRIGGCTSPNYFTCPDRPNRLG